MFNTVKSIFLNVHAADIVCGGGVLGKCVVCIGRVLGVCFGGVCVWTGMWVSCNVFRCFHMKKRAYLFCKFYRCDAEVCSSVVSKSTTVFDLQIIFYICYSSLNMYYNNKLHEAIAKHTFHSIPFFILGTLYKHQDHKTVTLITILTSILFLKFSHVKHWSKTTIRDNGLPTQDWVHN